MGGTGTDRRAGRSGGDPSEAKEKESTTALDFCGFERLNVSTSLRPPDRSNV